MNICNIHKKRVILYSNVVSSKLVLIITYYDVATWFFICFYVYPLTTFFLSLSFCFLLSLQIFSFSFFYPLFYFNNLFNRCLTIYSCLFCTWCLICFECMFGLLLYMFVWCNLLYRSIRTYSNQESYVEIRMIHYFS